MYVYKWDVNIFYVNFQNFNYKPEIIQSCRSTVFVNKELLICTKQAWNKKYILWNTNEKVGKI